MNRFDTFFNIAFGWLLRAAGFMVVVLLVLWLVKAAVGLAMDVWRMLGL